MDAKLARASHRSRNLHLAAADRHRERHGLGFISRELARGPSPPSASYSDRMHGDDTGRDCDGDDTHVEVVSGRQHVGNGNLQTVARPSEDEKVEVKENSSLRAEEVALETLMVKNPRRWRDSYEIVRPPQARVIVLPDSIPVTAPTPVDFVQPAPEPTDEDWERIGMDGEVEPKGSTVNKTWASIVGARRVAATA